MIRAGRLDRAVNYGILVIFTLFAVLPLVGIFLKALAPEPQASRFLAGRVSPDNFDRAWHVAGFSASMASSAIIAIAVTLGCTVVSVLAGFAFGTMRFRGSSFLFYVVLLGLILPLEATIIPLYYDLRGLGLIDTYWSVILSEIALYFAFGTFWMRAFFRSLPRSLLEAAQIDGASNWLLLGRILLPAARPAIMTLVVLLFMWSWNEFLLPLVLLSGGTIQTAPVALGLFVGEHTTDISGLAAAAVLVSVPVVASYVVLQRHFIRGVLSGSVRA